MNLFYPENIYSNSIFTCVYTTYLRIQRRFSKETFGFIPQHNGFYYCDSTISYFP